MKIPLYQVDAFTDKLFTGNPAAVCVLDEWIDDQLMQNIATENNLAETAFVVASENKYEIRWFTPIVEVDLCGHATLAAAFIIFNFCGFKESTISFYSQRSGVLSVKKEGRLLELDFPKDEITEKKIPNLLSKGLGTKPMKCFQGKTDLMAVFNQQAEVESINPDFSILNQLEARGIIVTAQGNEVDFVSRFFAPQSGINEDPATGSAHTALTPYWSAILGKKELNALQLSKRGGKLHCKIAGGRVKIAGNAILYLQGEITV